ncbi:hypothetical protein HMPREF1427_01439 [Helicobacter pylori GAM83Bi]|nr:hypothetical protein HMPREF1427_01439 [Helicobacter pylori GAM83Bi]EMH40950.1 hypothetical protein HMPREF1428_00128 [Helicobacter pylori GAM83T]
MLTASGLVILMSNKAKNFLAQAFKIPLTFKPYYLFLPTK